MQSKIKQIIQEVLQSIDVSNLPASEVKKIKDKNKNRKDVVYTSADEKLGDGKGLSEEVSNEDTLKEQYVRKYIRKYLQENFLSEEPEQKKTEPEITPEAEPVGSLEAMPTDDDIMIQRFPQLKEVLQELMGKDFRAFIKDIKYVAPKPTTFKIEIGDEHFNLIWSGHKTKFVCEVQGKKYYTIYTKEKEQAIKAINRLLRLGSAISQDEVQPNEDPAFDKVEDPMFSPSPKTENPSNISPDELDKI